MTDGIKLNGILFKTKDSNDMLEKILMYIEDDKNNKFENLLQYLQNTIKIYPDREDKVKEIIIAIYKDERFSEFRSLCLSTFTKYVINYDIIELCHSIKKEYNGNSYVSKQSKEKIYSYINELFEIFSFECNKEESDFILSEEAYSLLSSIVYSTFIFNEFSDKAEFNYIPKNMYKFIKKKVLPKRTSRKDNMFSAVVESTPKKKKIVQEDKKIIGFENLGEAVEEAKIEITPSSSNEEKKIIVPKIEVSSNANKELYELSIKKFILDCFNKYKYVIETKLLKDLADAGYYLTMEELKRYIYEIQRYVGIKSFKIYDSESGLVYKYFKNKCIDGKNSTPFEIKPLVNSTFKMLFISDRHYNLDIDTDTIKKDNEIINEYCVKNNVSCVFDLGDITSTYDSTFGKTLSFADKFLEASENNDKNITFGFLGGNHDSEILNKGFNMLEYFESNSSNMFNLGYTYNSIELFEGQLYLIHPNSTIFRINSLMDYDEISNKINSYVQNLFYNSVRQNKENFGTITGHFHKKILLPEDNVAMLGAGLEGCIEVSIVYDTQANATYLVFTPLSLGKKLYKSDMPVVKRLVK